MAFTKWTVTGNIGAGFSAATAAVLKFESAWAEPSQPAMANSSGNQVSLGRFPITVDTAGHFTVELADTNQVGGPAGWYINIRYSQPPKYAHLVTQRFGPFGLTANREFAAILNGGLLTLVPVSEAVLQQVYTARDQTVAVGNTNDTIIASRINDPASATHGALTATFAPMSADIINSAGASAVLMSTLEAGAASTAMQVVGDSTGNDQNEWVYLTALWLAARYPAYTVKHRVWNHTNQNYDAPTTIQTGTAGADRAAVLPGGGANYLAHPSETVNTITGDIDIRWLGSPDDVTPAAAQCLVSKFGSSGARGWRLTLKTDGKIEFQWSTDGASSLPTTTSTNAPGWTDGGTARWIRVTLTASTGQVNFYESTDGTNWTTLGAQPAAVGATSIYATTYELEIGARAGGSDPFAGKVREVQVLNSIGGAVNVVPALPDAWSVVSTSAAVTFTGAPVLEVINGSHPGGGLGYFNDATRLPKMTPRYGQVLTFLSTSHNDGGLLGIAVTAQWDSWLTALRTRLPASSFCVIAQNPRNAPADYIREHAARVALLVGWAKRNGLSAVNIYKAFQDYMAANGATIASLLDANGIHPTPTAQSTIYAPTVEAALARQA